MCAFKVTLNVGESCSTFLSLVNVLSVDVTTPSVCFAILLPTDCLAAQGQSSKLLTGVDFSTTGIGKVSPAPENIKYPMKGKIVAAITKEKRRLRNDLLRQCRICQNAIAE